MNNHDKNNNFETGKKDPFVPKDDLKKTMAAPLPDKKEDKAPEKEGKAVRGELTYDDKVIQKIIGTALGEIDGLLTVDGGFFSNLADKLVNTDNVTTGIETEVGKKQVAVDMDVVIEYGRDIPKLADEIKRVIHEQVNNMTHLDVIEVNINVVDIKTKEEYEKDSESLQDKVTEVAKSTGKFASDQTEKAKRAIKHEAGKVKDDVEEAKEPRVE